MRVDRKHESITTIRLALDVFLKSLGGINDYS